MKTRCAVLLLLLLPVAAAAQDPSPYGRRTMSVLGIGGRNFWRGRHGWAEFATPSINAGKFTSRRMEVGLDFHPWIGIRQAVNDNGDGGHENAHAVAIDAYGRWYPAPPDWTVRPYVELGLGPFYASRPAPAAGSRFNFLVEMGTGITFPVSPTDPWSVVVGYRFVHISNAHIYHRNPGWNFHGYVLGIRKFVGGRRD
jgi:opacity protein-like surface antigen